MNSDILYNPSIPHGTPDGFKQGCHGSQCPAPLPCRDVHRRYAGDYAFRRQYDAGVTLTDILTTEQEAARAVAAAERAARRAQKHPKTLKTPAGRSRNARKIDSTPTTPLQIEVVKWHSQGLTDAEIAEKVGKTRDQVRASRRWLGLPFNAATTMLDRVKALHAKGMNDIEMARELKSDPSYIGALRRRANLPLIKYPRVRIDPAEFTAAHAEGLTDKQLGLKFGVDARTAAKRRRRLDLPINPSTLATAGVSS